MSYALRRIALAIPLFIVVTFVTRGMFSLVPGDPVRTVLGASYTPENAERLNREFGLDRPLVIQYLKWIGPAFKGNFGTSFVSREPVSKSLGQWLPLSAHLVLFALLLALLMAIPLGIFSAYRQGTKFDRLTSMFSFASLSLPGFIIGLVLIFFVALRFTIGGKEVFPVGNYVRLSENVFLSFRSLFLPALTLAVGQTANFMRILRTDMVATLQENYITMAKSKGLSDRRILLRHAFRPSSFTLLTVAGINVGALLGNTLIIERVFNLPGLGSGIVSGIYSRDYLLVLGGVGVIVLVFLAVTTFVDIMYGVLDPRVRHARALA